MAQLSKTNAAEVAKARRFLASLPQSGEYLYAKIVSAAHRCSSKPQQDAIHDAIMSDGMIHAVDWVNGAMVAFDADRVAA